MSGNNEAGPSTSVPSFPSGGNDSGIPVQPSKIAKNARLPATMINPAGQIQKSQKKHSKNKQVSKKQKARNEKGKERAIELSEKLGNKVKEREEKKAKRQRAKKAWE
ncbi:hypothetical protein L486_07566 [Kwoniella mangroviensis CBS 10435]|uniref:Uncharacterized protein n=1 Tax=Kwoniella mangroviensis CBS 10435 TaxID=1331196 RepID=A0A1B9IHQ3_9TREE|nr:uncharacterized protein I203_03384 [Kwoniella mangroviensis CBS 8507]OCF54910.1 hypothetical protein L486_07566 [Kwoniella mangroviensis CBS 10435]OCF67686.1 hypothetical protein I203_03384 [Kwoniella mangroviensis CBS 8507]